MSSTNQKETTLRFGPDDILRMLRRRLPVILITTVLVSGMTFAIVLGLPAMYRSETLILVDPQRVPERYVSPTVSQDVGGRLGTITQEIKSSTKLQSLIDRFELYKNLKGRYTQEEITEQMRKDIDVQLMRNVESSGRGVGGFRIVYQGRNPNTVANVCNQLANDFINQNLKTREEQADGTAEFMAAQVVTAKKRLEETEQKLRDFKLQHVGELPEQAQANLANLNRLQTQLQAETDAINRQHSTEVYLESQLALLTAQKEAASAPALGDPGAEQRPASPAEGESAEVLRLKKTRQQVADQLAGLLTRYKEDHPDVRQAQESLKTLDKQIAAEEAAQKSAGTGTGTVAPASPRAGAPAAKADPEAAWRSNLQVLRSEIEQRTQNQKKINSQIQVVNARLDNMPIREQQIVDVSRDYEINKSVYQSLLDKQMAADMAADLEKRSKGEKFTLLDPARVPEKPFSPNRRALNLLGALGGLGLGLGLAFLLELRDDSVRTEGELAPLGLRTIARIPIVLSAGEVHSQRWRLVRNWALGTLATLVTVGLCGGAAAFITRRFLN